jgi:hypothetical protein
VKILLDENAPVDLLPVLRAAGRIAESVNFLGWKGLQNGDLLAKAQASYDLFVFFDTPSTSKAKSGESPMKSVKSSYRYNRLFILTCCITILLLTASGDMGRKLSVLKNIAPAASAQQDQDEAQQKAISLAKHRAMLEKWEATFLAYSIPFPPESLASENWREELAPAFKSMPQMRETRIEGTYLAGVYIADTLILPEKTKFVEDLFILANHLVFEGPKPEIEGSGGDTYIFLIKSDSVRRIKIDPTIDSPEEQIDGVNLYLRWICQKDSYLPTERELPSAIDLPKKAKNIRVIGNYVYFQWSTLRITNSARSYLATANFCR